MKKILCTVLSALLYAGSAKAQNDSIASLSDSLAHMTAEQLDAYADSVYRSRHPKAEEVTFDGQKLSRPNRQKRNFEYANSAVPSSASVNKSKAVGQIDIQPGVSPTGAKTYTVPIKAYKMDGVFCPDISLEYNSQGGGSAYGKGWSVGGLQSITRGNRSVYYDQKTKAVSLTPDDAFYLNGVRLVKTSTTGYEYQTEQGNIKAVATVEDGVTKYFNVYYPNGYKAVMGYATSNSNDLEYPITTLTDTRGRSITFGYNYDGGQYIVSNIYYDYYNAKIIFTYDGSRADKVHGYCSGVILNKTKLLKSIVCSRDGSELGTYTLSYTTDHQTSLLTQIDYSANGSSLNPIKFYYGDGSATASYEKGTTNLIAGYSYQVRGRIAAVRGRFNYTSGDDGIISFPNENPFYLVSSGSTNKLTNKYDAASKVYIYDGLSGNYVNPMANLTTETGFTDLLCADLDGRQEEYPIKINNVVSGNSDKVTFKVYWYTTTYGMVHRLTRDFYHSAIYTDGSGNKSVMPKYFFTGDFNGDGKAEVLEVTAENPFGETYHPSMCYVYDLINGTTLYSGHLFSFKKVLESDSTDPLSAENASDKIFPIDYDGDGKMELCHIHAGGMDIYAFEQSGSSSYLTASKVAESMTLMSTTLANKFVSCGDFNGDGLTDFIVSDYRNWLGGTFWSIYSSNGKGDFYASFFTGPDTKNTTSDFLVQDIDGDGVSDFVELTDSKMISYIVKNLQVTQGAEVTLPHTNETVVPVSLTSSSLAHQFVSLMGYEATLYAYGTCLRSDQTLTGMVNSNGVVDKNYYYRIDNDNSGIYAPYYNATFPYSNVFEPITVLAGNEVFVGGVSKDKTQYSYENAVMHRQGLGFRGFEKIKSVNNHGLLTTTTYEPFNYSMLKQVDSPTQAVTFTNSTSTDGYKRLKATVTQKTEYDKLRNVTATTGYTYDDFGQVLTENTSMTGGIEVDKAYTYTNFTDISSKYHLGRIATTATTTTRGSCQHTEETCITSYNDMDQPLTIINKVNGGTAKTTMLTYDYAGNVTSRSVKPYSSSTARTSTYQYTSINRLSKVTDPMGIWKSYTYNTDGTVSKTNAYTGETSYTYDAFGRLVKEQQPDGTERSTAFAWDSGGYGLYTVTKSGTGIPTVITAYDALNREQNVLQTRFNGNQTRIIKIYNNYGNLSSESFPYRGTAPTFKTYSYDMYDRLIKRVEAGKTTTYSYNGLSTTVSDGTLSTTTTTDALGATVSVTDPAGTITYTLNGAGSPTSITAPASTGGITTTIAYDSYGRRTSISDPSHGTTTYTYDAEGNLQQETNANNKTTSYTYDSYGRVTGRSVSEFQTTYSYDDNLNRLTAATSSNGTSTTNTYDSYGRLSSTKESAVDGKWLQKNYTYSNGMVSTIKYTAQSGLLTTENYKYANGYPTEMRLTNMVPIFQLDSEDYYGHTSGITTMGVTRNYGYYVNGQPTSRKATGNSQTIQNLTYNFSPATGNLTSRYNAQNGLTESFSYDNLHRLTSFDGTSVAYDDNGNITEMGDVGTFGYTHASKPYAVTEVTLSGSHTVGTQEVSYTSFDRPEMITGNGYTATFTYNGDYDRVKMELQHNSTATLTRYYLGGCYEIDVTPSGTIEKLYLNGDYYDAPMVLVKKDGSHQGYYNIIRDHLGSITHVTDGLGTVLQELSYDAWGRMRDPSTNALYAPGNEPEPYFGRGYCGHEHLTGLGLINMNARLYDPLLGRFLSPDPFVPAPFMSQLYNRYSYGMNNPLVCYDRNGEFPLLVIAGIVIGAYFGGTMANGYQMNPLKWNYSSGWTYTGIVIGGVAGGIAGSAIAGGGSWTIAAKLVTPWVTAGVKSWTDKNDNRKFEYDYDTVAGGHWNSSDKALEENGNKAYDDAISQYHRMKNDINTLSSNLAINSNAIYQFGPVMLKPSSYVLKNVASGVYYGYELTNIGKQGFYDGTISSDNQMRTYELIGESIGSSLGGTIAGTAMAGMFAETGPGAFYAGGYGYIVGAYMGSRIGIQAARSLYDIMNVYKLWSDWYNGYYSPMDQIDKYNHFLQNSYQPCW